MTERERFDIIRRGEERRRNREARQAYRKRQRQAAWNDAREAMARAFDGEWSRR